MLLIDKSYLEDNNLNNSEEIIEHIEYKLDEELDSSTKVMIDEILEQSYGIIGIPHKLLINLL